MPSLLPSRHFMFSESIQVRFIETTLVSKTDYNLVLIWKPKNYGFLMTLTQKFTRKLLRPGPGGSEDPTRRVQLFGQQRGKQLPTKSPVLFLIYNRPDTTREVFSAIREAKPERLFIAGDGSKREVIGDSDMVAEARRVSDEVDWPCEVNTLFRSENVGLKRAVGEAVTWFFDHVEEGIILEDDCLPTSDFFTFCDELLNKYRNDERISAITGNNFQRGRWRGEDSYYFSAYAHVWGWATWRRAWHHYDSEIKFWPELRDSQQLQAILEHGVHHWRTVMDAVYDKQFESTWDYPWQASVWRTGGLTATPNSNLVTNIGFGSSSTHTSDPGSKLSRMEVNGLEQLTHPKDVVQNKKADKLTLKFVFKGQNPYLKPFVSWLKVLRVSSSALLRKTREAMSR